MADIELDPDTGLSPDAKAYLEMLQARRIGVKPSAAPKTIRLIRGLQETEQLLEPNTGGHPDLVMGKAYEPGAIGIGNARYQKQLEEEQLTAAQKAAEALRAERLAGAQVRGLNSEAARRDIETKLAPLNIETQMTQAGIPGASTRVAQALGTGGANPGIPLPAQLTMRPDVATGRPTATLADTLFNWRNLHQVDPNDPNLYEHILNNWGEEEVNKLLNPPPTFSNRIAEPAMHALTSPMITGGLLGTELRKQRSETQKNVSLLSNLKRLHQERQAKKIGVPMGPFTVPTSLDDQRKNFGG